MDYTFENVKKMISTAELHRQNFLNYSETLFNWYEGNYSTDPNDYYINLAYSLTTTIRSGIYSRTPEFSFMLRGDINSVADLPLQRAKIGTALELGTKIYLNEMKFDYVNKLAITDTSWAGFGVTKSGYRHNIPKSVLKKYSDIKERIATGEKIDIAEEIEINTLIRKAQPFIVRINPADMLFPSVDSFYDLPWQAQIIFKDKEEAEAAYGVKSLPATGIDQMRCRSLQERDLLKNANKVKLIEVHILDPEQPYILTLAEGFDKFLKTKQHSLFDGNHVKNHFNYLWFNDSLAGVYPKPDLLLVAPQIREANEQVKRRVSFIKRSGRMYKKQGVWDDTTNKRLLEGEDGTVIESSDPSSTLEPISLLSLGIDFYNNIMAIRNEMLEILGVTDYSMGGNTQNRKATEASYVERGRKDRANERVVSLERFVFEEIDTFIEIMKQYHQVGRVFKLSIDDMNLPLEYTKELLQLADIETQVIPGSTVAIDRTAEQMKWKEIFNYASAFPNVNNVPALFKEYYRQIGLRNPDQYIIAGPGYQQIAPGADGRTPAVAGDVAQPGSTNHTNFDQLKGAA